MDATQPSWTVIGKIAFRFFAVYFILYVLPFPFGYIPGINLITGYYYQLWVWLVPWFGQYVLSLDISVLPNGSGDTTYNYVHILLIGILSLVACIAWSVLDRRRKSYDAMAYWSLIAVRYYLALVMMGYGFAKVFMMQFQLLDARLTQTYGDSSPMGLLWTFMGFSEAYNIFTGMGEVVGGVLLLFRRTATTGSLLLITILSNIVILNFSYDVPVKIFSSHLLVMAIVIALCDGKRIVNFILSKSAEPRIEKPYLSDGRIGRIRIIGNIVLVCWLLGSQVFSSIQSKREWARAPKPLLHGKYDVTEFYYNGSKESRPDDSVTWKSFRMDYVGYARAMSPSGHAIDFKLELDTLKKSFNLFTTQDQYMLSYRKNTRDEIELWGPRLILGLHDKRDTVRIKLQRTTKDPLLLTRGFNWINEYPYNK